jgi:hypothetical protein
MGQPGFSGMADDGKGRMKFKASSQVDASV